MLKNLPTYYKAVVAALGGVIIVVNEAAAIVPGTWSTGVLAALTAVSVFLVKNESRVEPTPPAA